MGSASVWTEKVYGPQRALSLSSRLFVLLRDELGLSRQPKIARLLVNEILAVVEDTLVPAERMQPGQLLVLAPEIGQGSSWQQSNLESKRLKAIRLNLIEPDDIESLAAGGEFLLLRRRRIARLIRQAYEQGATLSTCQLAVIAGYSHPAISHDIKAYEKETGEVLPTRGVIEDIGRGTSHKSQIVARHLNGESTAEIARNTEHTPNSVERYIRLFEQLRELVSYLDKVPKPKAIARILGCSEKLVAEYLELMPKDKAGA